MNQQRKDRKRALVLSGGGARGAYEVGVWRYLEEVGWKADIVTGSSVGSINGCLIAMGWSVDQMEAFWASLRKKHIYRYPIWARIKSLFRFITKAPRRRPSVFDSTPLHRTLRQTIDLDKIRNSKTELVITATDIERARLQYFVGDEITVKHVLASCSIPVFFPWQEVDGKTYWDGGIMANTPILPALNRHAKEIIVILLAPVFEDKVPLPKTQNEAAAWTLDLATIGAFKALGRYISQRFHLDLEETINTLSEKNYIEVGGYRIGIVAPQSAYSLSSTLDFSRKHLEGGFERGYNDAKKQLRRFLNDPRPPSP